MKSSKERARSASGRTSIVVFFLFLGLYLALLQSQPHSDGITYIWYLSQAKLAVHHILYLPLLYLFQQATEFLGLPLRTAAFAWSAVCGAGGVAILHRLFATSRVLCPGLRSPLLATLLIASTPVVLFYATTVENHIHHFLWVSIFLLALDRELASMRTGRSAPRAIAGHSLLALLLIAVYASHSSSLLLLPGLCLWLHVLGREEGARISSFPGPGTWLRLLTLLAPLLAFKYLEPYLKYWASGDTSQLLDGHMSFALSLLHARAPVTLLRYYTVELLLPIFGALVLLLALLFEGKERAKRALLLAAILLPYAVFFGLWNVYEYGAYFIAPLPILMTIALAGGAGKILGRGHKLYAAGLVLVLAQGAYGTWNAATYVSRQVAPNWTWAKDVAALTKPTSTVICYSGFRGVTLIVDQGLEDIIMLENWWILMAPVVEQDPEAIQRYSDAVMPRFFPKWTSAEHAPCLISEEAWSALARDWAPIRRYIEQHGVLERTTHGIFRGYVLRKKPD